MFLSEEVFASIAIKGKKIPNKKQYKRSFRNKRRFETIEGSNIVTHHLIEFNSFSKCNTEIL